MGAPKQASWPSRSVWTFWRPSDMDWPCLSPAHPPNCIGGSGLSLKLLPFPSIKKGGPKAFVPQQSFSHAVPGNSPLTRERGREDRQTEVLEGDWVQLIWSLVSIP